MSNYKELYDFETRLKESERIMKRNPDRVPVIVEMNKRTNDNSLPLLKKCKFLAFKEMTVGNFIYQIRKRIKLEPSKAIYLFVDDVLPPVATPMSRLYNEFKEVDNFLYCTISAESTFGDF